MKTKTFLLVSLALLFSLVACSPDAVSDNGAEPVVSPTERPTEQPTETPAVPDELLGVWYWLAYLDTAELNDISVSDPAKYTLEFLSDSMVQIQADCNNASSSVTINGSSLTFASGPMTLAECEPGSLYNEYLAKLGDVVTYVIDEEGNLTLNLKAAAGNMVFARTAETGTVNELEGTSWVLSGILADDVVNTTEIDSEITAVFQDGQITGSAGCNNYFTGYETDNMSLILGPIGSTRMACDEAHNQREAEFLMALETATGYHVADDTLELVNADGNVQILFQMQVETAVPDELLGTWYWLAYQDSADGAESNDISVSNPAKYTLEFLSDSTVQIQADCNSASSSVTINDSSLTFAPGPMTLAECEPGSLYNEYLAKLGDVVTFVLEDGKLHLNLKMDAGNMVFSPDNDTSGIEFNYTFEDGPDGWLHGFADLPADADFQDYQLDGSWQELPGELVGGGYNLRGENHSDDLFMFLKVQAGGLEPNTTYGVKFLIDLVTAVPEGQMGIGGSSGESVYLKVGAVSIEPDVIEEDDGYLRMNIDKGQQSQGGADMIVLGHIAYALDGATDGSEWQIKSLDNVGQSFRITTDDSGQVWFIVGTDSGFEGLTNIYFDAISISLTPAND